MRNVKIIYVLSALALLLLPSLASVASACTCGSVSPCESYADASVVFVGTAVQTGLKATPQSFPANAISTTLTRGGVMSAQFKVEEPFFGVRGARIDVSGQGTTCDYQFTRGVGPGGRLISSKPVVIKVEKDNSPVKLVVEKP